MFSIFKKAKRTIISLCVYDISETKTNALDPMVFLVTRSRTVTIAYIIKKQRWILKKRFLYPSVRYSNDNLHSKLPFWDLKLVSYIQEFAINKFHCINY